MLAHHGVRGMKWGSRKSSSDSGSGKSELKPSADHKTVTGFKDRAKSGGVKNLSNEELQKLVNRMNLEQQHRNLTSQEPGRFEKGHQHIKKVLGVAKTVNDAYNTGKALNKTYNEVRGAINTARSS